MNLSNGDSLNGDSLSGDTSNVAPILQANKVSYRVGQKALLHDISFNLHANDFVAILGPNGAGKSTLFKCLSGERPSTRARRGQVSFLGRDLHDWRLADLAKIRAVLPQSSELSFAFKVRDVVLFGRYAHRDDALRTDNETIVREALGACDAQGLIDRLYPSLSGGEKARVQCARVLAQVWLPWKECGRVLMLDEPTAALDLKHQMSVLNAAKSFATQTRCATIAVLHDVNLAARFATRIIWLVDGRLLAQGTVNDMLTAPLLKQIYGIDSVVITHPTLNQPLTFAA